MRKIRKQIQSGKKSNSFWYAVIILLSLIVGVYFMAYSNLDGRTRAQIYDPSSIKLRTITIVPTTTLTLTPAPQVQVTLPPSQPGSIITPAIGGPQPPSGYYCIDDVDPDMCDDENSYLVPKGASGVSGSCGTVIAQAHKLVDALPQYMKGLRDALTTTVSNCGYSTGPASGYVSTHFVIDTYNLAGFSDLSKSKAAHVSPSGLFSWWQSAPSGYEFIPYSPTVVQAFGSGQKDLTGCVMFLQTSSSYHIGIVNYLELYTANGDGVISILQSGTRMYIDRFPVAAWNIENTSTNQTSTQGVVGFGCHT